MRSAGEREKWKAMFNVFEKFLEIVCTTLGIYLTLLICIRKTVKEVCFVICILPQIKINKPKSAG